MIQRQPDIRIFRVSYFEIIFVLVSVKIFVSFSGDISEQFLPLMGENTGAVSSTPGKDENRIFLELSHLFLLPYFEQTPNQKMKQ